MGIITGQQIADRAWTMLNDTVSGGGVRWPTPEVLMWINDAQRAIVGHLPSAFTKAVRVTTAAGTRQEFAALGITDGLQPIRVPRNFSTDGATPGRAITVKPMEWISNSRPNWHNDAAGEAIHVFFDPEDPTAFYLWPPASGTTKVELVYSATPTDLPGIGSSITLADIYANPIIYFVLFRALSKNASFTRAPASANGYYQLFLQALGVKGASARQLDLNTQMAADGSGVTT